MPRLISPLILALLLAACGGGGDEDEPIAQFPPECQKDPRLCK